MNSGAATPVRPEERTKADDSFFLTFRDMADWVFLTFRDMADRVVDADARCCAMSHDTRKKIESAHG